MSFLLCDKDGNECLSTNNYGWYLLLDTATKYGWNPEGTNFCPNDSDWPGYYDTNDGQIMSEKDVANMIAALKKALQNFKLWEQEDELFLNKAIKLLHNKGELGIY